MTVSRRNLKRPRLDHEFPPAIAQWGWRFHHVGIPTSTPGPGETHLEAFGMHVSGFPESPYGVEWMRFDPDSPVSELIRTVPHLAFVTTRPPVLVTLPLATDRYRFDAQGAADVVATMPLRGSVKSVCLGNTQNHASSRPACGYLRSSASGSQTPEARTILLVDRLGRAQLCTQWLSAPVGQERRAVLVALAATHDEQSLIEVHVLDTQLAAFDHAQAAPVDERRHQPRRATHGAQQGPRLGHAEDRGETRSRAWL